MRIVCWESQLLIYIHIMHNRKLFMSGTDSKNFASLNQVHTVISSTNNCDSDNEFCITIPESKMTQMKQFKNWCLVVFVSTWPSMEIHFLKGKIPFFFFFVHIQKLYPFVHSICNLHKAISHYLPSPFILSWFTLTLELTLSILRHSL